MQTKTIIMRNQHLQARLDGMKDIQDILLRALTDIQTAAETALQSISGPPEARFCIWSQHIEDFDAYSTTCGCLATFYGTDHPTDACWDFCPYCGAALTVNTCNVEYPQFQEAQ